jgi:hypothetical protein
MVAPAARLAGPAKPAANSGVKPVAMSRWNIELPLSPYVSGAGAGASSKIVKSNGNSAIIMAGSGPAFGRRASGVSNTLVPAKPICGGMAKRKALALAG